MFNKKEKKKGKKIIKVGIEDVYKWKEGGKKGEKQLNVFEELTARDLPWLFWILPSLSSASLFLSLNSHQFLSHFNLQILHTFYILKVLFISFISIDVYSALILVECCFSCCYCVFLFLHDAIVLLDSEIDSIAGRLVGFVQIVMVFVFCFFSRL